jgi:hypothetical protein
MTAVCALGARIASASPVPGIGHAHPFGNCRCARGGPSFPDRMTHHTILRRAILLTLSALTIAVAAAPAASADLDFSQGCTGRGPIMPDNKSHLRRAVYCPNFVAPVYGPGPTRIDT